MLLSTIALPASGCQRASEVVRFACAAGLRRHVEPTVEQWSRGRSISVQTLYDGSGRLVAQARAGQRFDVFLAADESYLDEISAYSERTRLLTQQARLVCRVREETRITWEDVITGRVRLSLALPETAAISRVCQAAIGETTWSRLSRAAIAHRTNVTDVANDVASLEVADAGLIWNTTWPGDERLATVPAPQLTNAVGQVSIALSDSPTPAGRQLYEALSAQLPGRLRSAVEQ